MGFANFWYGALALAAVAAAPAPTAAQEADAGASLIEATVETGRLGGIRGADGVAAFKAIPFAAPPVGPLRWSPPQPAAPWEGVRDAGAFSPDCQQAPFEGDQAPSRAGFSEDCLYLNVWAPASVPDGEALPVMVWIHGGGFVNGGASAAIFDGAGFARDGVILVSVNYRLGRFGFFAHPALAAERPESPLGNYALMDMIAALRWVQRNITAFGGDPDRVTVFGGSTGGWAVHALMTSPAAEGLFAQAIAQSAFSYDRLPPVTAPEGQRSGEALGLQISESLGVTDSGATGLSQLRALPAETVTAGLNMLTMGRTLNIGPMLDGEIVLEPPAERYRAGMAADVPLLVGANDADALFSLGPDLDSIYAPFGDRRAEAEAFYDPMGEGDPSAINARIASDLGMNAPARAIAGNHAQAGAPAFLYRFSYVAEASRDGSPGAAHGTEAAYVFDTVSSAHGNAVTASDARAARQVHTYWVAFAKTGRLAPPGLPLLPEYDPDSPALLEFSAQGPTVGPDPLAARLDFIEEIAAAQD